MTESAAGRRWERFLFGGQPFFFAASFVLASFAESSAPPSDLWRPLILSQVAVAIVLGPLLLVARRYAVAALLTSALFAILVNYTLPALIMTAIALWWALIAVLRRYRCARGGSIAGPARIAMAFSVLLFFVGFGYAAFASWPRASDHASLANGSEAGDRPNIYIVLLDGYPRADTLINEFGIDNEPFLADLESLGFDVSRQAQSNYNKTWLTVASLMDARYVHTLPEFSAKPDRQAAQMRLMHQVIEKGSVTDFLRAQSYDVVSIPSPITSTDVLDGSDVRSTGHMTAFEIIIVSHSLLARVMPEPILEAIAADQRQNVSDQLNLLRQAAAEDADAPRILLTHLMSPHLPFILGQSPDYLSQCFPYCDFWTTPLELLDMDEREFAERLATQVGKLNESVIFTLETIVTDDPSAVVIVMSDHGIRHHIDNWDEHFDMLFAARTPGREMFGDDVSPVNVFRRILTEVFGADLPDLPYEAWRSDWDLPMLLAPVD